MTAKSKSPYWCSFCGRSNHDPITLIAGPTVFICDICVDACVGFLAVDRGSVDGEAEYLSWLA